MELEEIMEQLEQTVDKMENEKLSLEEAYETFSHGMKLVMQGNKAIDRVEKKIEVLMKRETEDSEDE
ncbi:MAG: exodeoxyribonuclease VII small subunit [Roseburia sp.]|nr:exodeoxyribonuclease VII small subunit [Roseburia sp.]